MVYSQPNASKTYHKMGHVDCRNDFQIHSRISLQIHGNKKAGLPPYHVLFVLRIIRFLILTFQKSIHDMINILPFIRYVHRALSLLKLLLSESSYDILFFYEHCLFFFFVSSSFQFESTDSCSE